MIARTDWEVISDGSVFDTLNFANLTGFAGLAQNPAVETADLIMAQLGAPIWTALSGGLDEDRFSIADQTDLRAALAAALADSWEIMPKSIFVLRQVFHEDCMVPDTLRKANMMLEEIHGLVEWDPSAMGALAPNEATFAVLCPEKDAALALVERHADSVVSATASLSEPGRSQMIETFDLWVHYVRIFRLCARACFAVRTMLASPADATRVRAGAEIASLDTGRAALAARLEHHPTKRNYRSDEDVR